MLVFLANNIFSCFSVLVIIGISDKFSEFSSVIKFAKTIPRIKQLIAIPAPNKTDGRCIDLVFFLLLDQLMILMIL